MCDQAALGAGKSQEEPVIRVGADGALQRPSTDVTPQLERIRAGILEERHMTQLLFRDIIERNFQ